jgi:hypothetical protein
MNKCVTYNFWCYFCYSTCYRLSSPSVICHLKFNWIPNLQMFYIPIELTEVEEQTCLTLTALNEPVRVLTKTQFNFETTFCNTTDSKHFIITARKIT